MNTEQKAARRQAILRAAVRVLLAQGYTGTSMLAIAREASASKETLYNWFGDKQGLFEAVVADNAAAVQGVIADSLASGEAAEQTLRRFGVQLLQLLTGEESVAINRAAIAALGSDPSLAESLVRAGREATLPVLGGYLRDQAAAGALAIDDVPQAGQDLLGLLLGNVQVQRLLGAVPALDEAEIEARAAHAVRQFCRLYGAA